MKNKSEVRDRITRLFDSQNLAVLSTHSAGQPYASLVAFYADDDLRSLYFVTPRSTRKYENIESDARVALLVNNSTNQADDFHEAIAVTLLGTASDVPADQRPAILEKYLARHPHLEEFARSPSCALVRVAVRTYVMVHNFQDVVELHIGE